MLARTETSRSFGSKEHAERGRGRSRSRERNSDDAPNRSGKVKRSSMMIENVIVQSHVREDQMSINLEEREN